MLTNDNVFSLFIGDLSKFCNEAEVERLFSDYGPVLDVKIKRNNNTGKTLSYGFVTFGTESDALGAMEKLDETMFFGRRLRIRWAMYNARSQNPITEAVINSVYVRFSTPRLDKFVTEEDLHSVFDGFGCVEDVSIKESSTDKSRGGHKQSGYGFVHFTNDAKGIDAAFQAVQNINNMTYQGVTYNVELSKNLLKQFKEQQANGEGGGGGGGSVYGQASHSAVRSDNIHPQQSYGGQYSSSHNSHSPYSHTSHNQHPGQQHGHMQHTGRNMGGQGAQQSKQYGNLMIDSFQQSQQLRNNSGGGNYPRPYDNRHSNAPYENMHSSSNSSVGGNMDSQQGGRAYPSDYSSTYYNQSSNGRDYVPKEHAPNSQRSMIRPPSHEQHQGPSPVTQYNNLIIPPSHALPGHNIPPSHALPGHNDTISQSGNSATSHYQYSNRGQGQTLTYHPTNNHSPNPNQSVPSNHPSSQPQRSYYGGGHGTIGSGGGQNSQGTYQGAQGYPNSYSNQSVSPGLSEPVFRPSENQTGPRFNSNQHPSQFSQGFDDYADAHTVGGGRREYQNAHTVEHERSFSRQESHRSSNSAGLQGFEEGLNFDEFGGNNSEKVSYDKPYYEERDSLERQPMRASRGEPYRDVQRSGSSMGGGGGIEYGGQEPLSANLDQYGRPSGGPSSPHLSDLHISDNASVYTHQSHQTHHTHHTVHSPVHSHVQPLTRTSSWNPIEGPRQFPTSTVGGVRMIPSPRDHSDTNSPYVQEDLKTLSSISPSDTTGNMRNASSTATPPGLNTVGLNISLPVRDVSSGSLQRLLSTHQAADEINMNSPAIGSIGGLGIIGGSASAMSSMVLNPLDHSRPLSVSPYAVPTRSGSPTISAPAQKMQQQQNQMFRRSFMGSEGMDGNQISEASLNSIGDYGVSSLGERRARDEMNEAMASHAIGGRDMGGGGRDMGAMTAAMSETNLGEADGGWGGLQNSLPYMPLRESQDLNTHTTATTTTSTEGTTQFEGNASSSAYMVEATYNSDEPKGVTGTGEEGVEK